MRHSHKILVLLFFVIGSIFLLFSQSSDSYDMTSFSFVDQRRILGIPNFMDVISNIPFLIVGLMGLIFLKNHPQKEAMWSWRVLFTGVFLVAFGSSFYHLWPAPETLLWDRLPMTIGFMGLLVAFLSEFVDKNMEKWILLPLLILGVVSVVIWYVFDDIRLYIWVQFFPLVLLPVILLLYSSPYSHKSYLLGALGFYVLAKISELKDIQIYHITGDILSGHSLKHILAAVSVYYLYLMIKRRTRNESF
ncbi:MAG: ceramidase domain-containing protein [Bdellovibrionales bacterium]|nr:ceramidase domain-containing protein [Bdellovibrionales bacterium]